MNGSHIPRHRHLQVALAALLVATAAAAPAADLYWSGTGTWDTTTTTWGTVTGGPYDAATWSNAPPDAAFFEGTAGTVTLGEPITAAGLTFSTTGYTVTGNTLTLSGTPSIATGTGISATIASVLEGTSGFAKTGGGTLTLSSANSISGAATVSAGRIVLGSDTALGTTAVTLDGGSIERNAVGTVSNAIAVGAGGGTIVAAQPVIDYTNFTGQLTGNGGLTLDGLVRLSGSGGTYSGTITLADSATYLRLSTATAIAPTASITTTNAGFIRLDGVTVEVASVTSNGQVFNVGTGTVGRLRVGAGSMSGAIVNNVGQLAIEKFGSGTLTVSGNNSYSGGTRLEAGILAVDNNAALGSGLLTLAGGTIRPTATRTIANAISVATGTTSGLIDGGSGDLMYTGAATGNGNLAANSPLSRSMWLQGDWSGFTGQITFTVNGGGTNYRLGGTPGATSSNTGTNGSDFSQATFVLSGTGVDRGLSWNGAQGATVRVGTLSGTGGRIISGADNRDANWEVGSLNQDSTAAVVITGNATSLTKVGTGTLTLTGSNTYGGTTTVSAGTLKIGNESALGTRQATRPVTQVVVAAGAALDLNGIPDATYGYTISGAGNGSGALVNTGAEIGTGRAQATNLRLAADATIGGTGNWALLGSGFSATSLDLAGLTLTKAGSNTIWLRTTTITAGTITINAGTLQALADTTSATSTAFSLANVAGATLSVNNGGTLSIGSLAGGGTTGGGVALANGSLSIGSLNTDTTYDGSITGGGRVVKTGTGTLTLNGASGYSGSTLIQAGMVKAGRATALGAENAAASTVTIASGATLDINRVTGNTGDFFYGLTIAGSGTAGQGALINTGANGGTGLRQTPNITLSGNATIGGSGNILMINSSFAANSLNLAGNTLTKTGTNTLFMANTTVSAGTIDIQQGTLSHFNTAANASAAAITLADAAGATLALNNLGLQVGSLAGGGATGGNVTLGSATLTLGGRNENSSFGGAISGTGAVVKTGTGTQTFANANSYSGGTTISAGTLVAGSANAFGTAGAISVGASGTLGVGDGVTFTRPFSLTAGGRVRTGNNSTVSLPSVAALAAWESQSGSGDQTLAEILNASGSTTPTALFSAWTANPDSSRYLSDILTLEGTGAGNTYVLSMDYATAFDNLNIWYRADVGDPFTPLGTSFQGNVPWTSGFTTVGQYGVDTSAGTVWVVTDHNSQFVVVPEPGALGLAAAGFVGGFWYLLGRRATRRP